MRCTPLTAAATGTIGRLAVNGVLRACVTYRAGVPTTAIKPIAGEPAPADDGIATNITSYPEIMGNDGAGVCVFRGDIVPPAMVSTTTWQS
jgi:hypothetical protein